MLFLSFILPCILFASRGATAPIALPDPAPAPTPAPLPLLPPEPLPEGARPYRAQVLHRRRQAAVAEILRREQPTATVASSAGPTSTGKPVIPPLAKPVTNATSHNALKGGPSGKSSAQCGSVCEPMWDNYVDKCHGERRCICNEFIARSLLDCYNCDLNATSANDEQIHRTQMVFWAYDAKCRLAGQRVPSLRATKEFSAAAAFHARSLLATASAIPLALPGIALALVFTVGASLGILL